MASLAGFVVLGDRLDAASLLAILIGVGGVVLLSRPSPEAGRLWPVLGLGLGAGALFAVSGTAYRGAALSLPFPDAFLRGAFTLACVTLFQSAAMTLWFALRDRSQLQAVFSRWQAAATIALFSGLGSLGWFTAFAMQNVALVKAVGKVEIVLSLLASWLIFGERLRGIELSAIALVLISVTALVLI